MSNGIKEGFKMDEINDFIYDYETDSYRPVEYTYSFKTGEYCAHPHWDSEIESLGDMND